MTRRPGRSLTEMEGWFIGAGFNHECMENGGLASRNAEMQ